MVGVGQRDLGPGEVHCSEHCSCVAHVFSLVDLDLRLDSPFFHFPREVEFDFLIFFFFSLSIFYYYFIFPFSFFIFIFSKVLGFITRKG